MQPALLPVYYGIGIIVWFCLLAAIASRISPFYRMALQSEDTTHLGHLDGLRGLLAISVFVNHYAYSYMYNFHGVWKSPDHSYYLYSGVFPIALFFQLSSFLFWRQAMANPQSICSLTFLKKRFWRLYPLYLFSVAAAVLMAFQLTYWQWRTTLPELLTAISHWLVLDIPRWLEHNNRLPNINGYPGQRMNVVLWTLRYEWLFYLALPLLALCAKRRWFPMLFLALLGWYYYSKHIAVVSYYTVILNMLAGMTAAWLLSGRMPTAWLTSRTAAACMLLLICMSPYLKLPEPYGEKQTLLLFALFLPVAAGNNLFGLLSSKPLRLLGIISYSLYLLHYMLLHFVVKTSKRMVGIANMSDIQFWLLFMAIAALATGLCMLTYRWIEYPGIRRKSR